MEWKPIDDNTPYDVDILVRGGEMESDIPYGDTSYIFAHVMRDSRHKVNTDIDEWSVQNTCYYSVWVENPTEYCLIQN